MFKDLIVNPGIIHTFATAVRRHLPRFLRHTISTYSYGVFIKIFVTAMDYHVLHTPYAAAR